MDKKNQPTEQQSSKKGLVIVLGLLVLALGGLSGFLYTKVVSFEEQFIVSQEVVEDKEGEIDYLTDDLTSKIAEYEALSDNYEELGIENSEIQEQIAALKEEVKTWKSRKWASDAERKKAEKKMSNKLAELQLDLASKTEEVERLKLANESLSSSVDSLIEVNGFHTEDISNLSKKVEIASILKTEDLVVSILTPKDKEIIKDEYKAKTIQRVRIKFNLADNKVAKKDLKSMVLQIVEPKGSVLFDIEQGGGSFHKSDGHNDFYTKKQMINFTNTHQAINFFYEKGDLMDSGTYQVIVYAQGHEIGATSFIVK
jgi:predicted nuclease with TOPRIM domain